MAASGEPGRGSSTACCLRTTSACRALRLSPLSHCGSDCESGSGGRLRLLRRSSWRFSASVASHSSHHIPPPPRSPSGDPLRPQPVLGGSGSAVPARARSAAAASSLKAASAPGRAHLSGCTLCAPRLKARRTSAAGAPSGSPSTCQQGARLPARCSRQTRRIVASFAAKSPPPGSFPAAAATASARLCLLAAMSSTADAIALAAGVSKIAGGSSADRAAPPCARSSAVALPSFL